MASLFKRFEVKTRDTVIKQSLISELMEALKVIQLEKVEESDYHSISDDAAGALCTILEAIFVHGIKESISDRMAAALNLVDHAPTPEFWTPMMVFAHSATIKEITSMNQIANDVGRSRCWLRLSLNEGTFLGYLQMLIQDNKSLSRYYQKSAFLRDVDSLVTAVRILQCISRFKFKCPTNSILFNHWNQKPLLLAGMWTPPMKPDQAPVSSGLDIVKSLQDSSEDETSISLSFDSLAVNPLLLDDDEALKKILNTPARGSPLQEMTEKDINIKEEIKLTKTQIEDKKIETQSYENEKVETIQIAQEPEQIEKIIDIPHSTMESYEKILEAHDPKAEDPLLNEPKLKDFLQQYRPSFSLDQEIESPTSDEDKICEMGFEIVSKGSTSNYMPELKMVYDRLRSGQIMQEPGLLSENFSCKQCKTLIGIIQKKLKIANVCALTGFYYCDECFKPIESYIPARIIHNWDFARYPVCESSANFLNDIQCHPIFNIREINPKIYFVVSEMNLIQKLRVKMNYLRPYLYTCRSSIRTRIQKLLWPREYLYEHVHFYAIADLLEVPSGVLVKILKRAIHISLDHVKTCEICQLKGFICEYCDNKSTIFPFEASTHMCSNCGSVSHLECKEIHPCCKKCERMKTHRETLEKRTSVDDR